MQADNGTSDLLEERSDAGNGFPEEERGHARKRQEEALEEAAVVLRWLCDDDDDEAEGVTLSLECGAIRMEVVKERLL